MSFSARAAAFVKFWLFSLAIALALLGPGLANADGFRPFSRIVVFGDSLSDPGNAYALSGQHLEPPYAALHPLTLVPESETPYAVGGNRFSNGPTWVEQLGTAIGLGWSVKPAYVKSRKGSSNYAVGGTRARDDVAGEVSLSQQVHNFLVRDGGAQEGSRVLYVIAVGGNDINDAIATLSDGVEETTPQTVIGAALESLAMNIVALYQKGAKKVVIWNVPNLGRTPAVQRVAAFQCAALPDPAQPLCVEAVTNGVRDISAAYNAALESLLNQLEGKLEGIRFIRFDAFAKLQEVQDHKRRYGLRNVKDACIEPFQGPDYRCDNPDQYLFWDGTHPTRAGHAIIAFLVAKELLKAAVNDD